ncbi:MAG: M14 family metallopeptidase [Patescibacteria group bacterium]
MKSGLVKFFVAIIVIAVVILLALFFLKKDKEVLPPPLPPVVVKEVNPRHKIIGTSVQGRTIDSYTYLPTDKAGDASAKHLLLVGGIHGGYEWNGVLLAYKLMDYLEANPEFIPKNLTVTIIPSANPDGVYKVIGKEGRFSVTDIPAKEEATVPGRFNANKVDLNRNFDCKWQADGVWKGNKVSGGTTAFSEPEARTLRDFVLENKPSSVIFWHSQANAVYASECENGILSETAKIMKTYSQASGYPAVDTFTAYQVTGDAGDWLASIGIPAITVELKTHTTIEWEQNLAGIKALFEYYKNN